MTEDTLLPFGLPAVSRKKVTVDFEGGLISSDGGLVLLRAAERRLGLAEALAGCIREPRHLYERVWRDLDAAFDEFRGRGRNTPDTLIAQLDHNGKLSGQLTRAGRRRTRVLYPKSGDNMRGARSQLGSFVVDDTLYYFNAVSAGEVGYLTALLNAPCLSHAFRESRTSGRHFDQQPWRTIPIPRYDADHEVHRELARLCSRAERAASTWLSRQTTRYGQAATSSRIRSLLDEQGISEAIDRAAAAVLPEHAHPG